MQKGRLIFHRDSPDEFNVPADKQMLRVQPLSFVCRPIYKELKDKERLFLMASNPLANYLGKVKTKSERESNARQQQILQWQKALDKLYEQIESLTGSEAKLTYKTMQVREQDLGIYEIRTLTMEIGPVQMSFMPRGTIIPGSRGRVDMKGPRGSIRLIRKVEGRSKERWMVCTNPDAPKDSEPLTAATLAWGFQYVIEGPHSVIPRRVAGRKAQMESVDQG